MKAIFTNDDAGSAPSGHMVEWFETVSDWLAGQGIRGTFFWVPKPREFEKAHALWPPALHRAKAKGHDFQLHGFAHDNCLEFGVPQASTRRANAKPFEDYEADTAHWQEQHAAENLQRKIEEGIVLYGETFGGRPVIFRSPCLGVCPQMYEALHRAGIGYSSSRTVNPTATAYTKLRDPALRTWAPDFPCTPWTEPPGVVEVSAVEDLCITGVPADDYDDRLDLYLSELGHVIDEIGPDGTIVLCSHYHSMMRTWDQTRPLMERVIEWLAEQGVTEWLTFGEYVGR